MIQVLRLVVVSVACRNSRLLIWNGFASPIVAPEHEICGKLHFYDQNVIERKSSHFRVVLRCVAVPALHTSAQHLAETLALKAIYKSNKTTVTKYFLRAFMTLPDRKLVLLIAPSVVVSRKIC